MTEPVNKQLESNILKLLELNPTRRILLCGSPPYLAAAFAHCKKLNCTPHGLIVEDGYDVDCPHPTYQLRLEELRERYQRDMFIIIASKSCRELGMYLINLGLEPEKDFSLAQVVDSSLTMQYEIGTTYIGKHCHGVERFLSLYSLYVRTKHIGAFCSIAADAKLVTQHVQTNISTSSYIEWGGSQHIEDFPDLSFLDQRRTLNGVTRIGNDVWIGYRAIIMPGVRLGNGCVIGAGAVVTKDVPPYAIALGVPAKVVKYRFTPEQISLLENIQWWNWSDIKLKEQMSLFYSPEKFFDYAKQQLDIGYRSTVT